MTKRRYESPAITWIGYVQTPTEVIDAKPCRDPLAALARARKITAKSGPTCVCVRRFDVEAPSVSLRLDISYSEAGLCAGNPGAMAINKAHWSKRCAYALCRTAAARARTQRGMR
jgi:hypothetical protein